jgi:hypothetical protein
MAKRISTLVVSGVSLLLTLGLSASFFLYHKLEQRVEDAEAVTHLLEKTRVRVREAQVAYLATSVRKPTYAHPYASTNEK